MGAKDILAELAELGAVGNRRPEKPTVSAVTLEQGPPSTGLRDRRGASMLEHVERAVGAVDRMGEAYQVMMEGLGELRESLIAIHGDWSEETPTEEEEGEEPTPEEDQDEEVEVRFDVDVAEAAPEEVVARVVRAVPDVREDEDEDESGSALVDEMRALSATGVTFSRFEKKAEDE